MRKIIYHHVLLKIAGMMLSFVLINFLLLAFCVQNLNQNYQQTIAESACSFASLTIDADAAKDYLILRKTDDAYTETLQLLTEYQQQNPAVQRISLVNFSSTTGTYIYDTDGMSLGSSLAYTDYTKTVQTELIDGHNTWTQQTSTVVIYYAPLRTVDDRLVGYLMIQLSNAFQKTYLPLCIGISAGIVLIGIGLLMILMHWLNKVVFSPIKQLTETVQAFHAEQDISSFDLPSVFANNEIGQLEQAVCKIFLHSISGAKDFSKVVYEANHDGMTQLFNKRYYQAMEESFRHCSSICVIYFDVNNLKLMNDTLGHEKGDYVIKKASEYIRSFHSASEYCFRMGGDEFLMVMTDCSLREIDAMIEKLDADAPYILSQPSDSVPCAISYGYAYAKGNYSYEMLLTEAEENMYMKKAELKKRMQMPDR